MDLQQPHENSIQGNNGAFYKNHHHALIMLEQYYHLNEAAGVSIVIGKDGTDSINACAVSVQNRQLNFEKKLTDLKDLDDLAKSLPAKTALSLNLSGKGILHKQIEKAEEINQSNFTLILPNANIEDFYVQHFISGNHSFVSVIRKTDADKWIGQLKEMGYLTLMLSLGPFPVHHIISQLNIYENEMVFDGHIIQRNEQSEWVAYTYKEKAVSRFPLKVESESIKESLLVAYSAAFQLLLSQKLIPVGAYVPILEAEFKTLQAGKKLKVHGFLALSVFFILLLINFFLFSSLNAANAKLANQLSRSAQSTSDVQQVNSQVQEKEALLKTLGWEASIHKSSLVDQVAALLPTEITWKEASVDPIDLSASRIQKTIVFYNRKIRITGNSENIIPVNEWMARIKTRAWVKNIQLDIYTFNTEQNTGLFTIVIDY
jgi:Tfp pilus assembly protein PilN